MKEREFVNRLRSLTRPKSFDEPDALKTLTESDNLVRALKWEVKQRGKGKWHPDIATQVLTEFEWLMKQPPAKSDS